MKVLIRKKTILLLLFTGLLIMFIGCQKKINFLAAGVYPEDEKESPFPPKAEELRPTKYAIAFVPIEPNPHLTRHHLTLSRSFIQSILEESGNLRIIEDYRVDNALKFTEFKDFDVTSMEDVIKLGEFLKVKYIAVLRVQESPLQVDEDDWATYINVRISQLSPTKVALDESFNYVFSKSIKIKREFRTKVEAAFPLRGFILETRNRHAYARISLGRNHSIRPERVFQVYRRIIEVQEFSDGSTKTSESYSKLLGEIEISEVAENESWGIVKKQEDRSKILKGDAVFLKPQ